MSEPATLWERCNRAEAERDSALRDLAETRGRLDRVRLRLSTMHAGNWATVLAETLALALASPTPRDPEPPVSRPLDAVERVLAVECPRHGKDPCQGSSSHDADPWFCASRIRSLASPPQPVCGGTGAIAGFDDRDGLEGFQTCLGCPDCRPSERK